MGTTYPKGQEQLSTSDLDGALDDVLHAIAHAPPRLPPVEPTPGAPWGTGDRYLVEKHLGSGGMGSVYLATDKILRRQVALKVIEGADVDRAAHRGRLLREAQSAAAIEHERVARVYDVGEHEGALFVAMEFVRGTTLRAWMRGRNVSSDEAVTITVQLTEGLGALHACGLVHRDLKPENVMLSNGGLKVLDFGLAKRILSGSQASEGTLGRSGSAGALSGTVGYMAPEQCLGEPVDARTDIFALGILIYELVEKRRPFEGATAIDVARSTLGCTPTFHVEAWSRITPKLREVVVRALSRNPLDRWNNAEAILEQLRETSRSGNAPISTLPVSVRSDLEQAVTVLASRSGRRGWIVPSLIVFSFAAILAADHPVPSSVTMPAPNGMALVDGGFFDLGRSKPDLEEECSSLGRRCQRDLMERELPLRRVAVRPFFMDVHEVTVDDFANTLNTVRGTLEVREDSDDHYPRYVALVILPTTAASSVLYDLWRDGSGIEYAKQDALGQSFRVKSGKSGQPVTQVTWFGADFFCRSRGKRLPSEDEWEAAARGSNNRRYPWGDDPPRCDGVLVPYDDLLPTERPPACSGFSSLKPVGTSRQDVTPEGIHDLGGSVTEWVDTPYVPRASGSDDITPMVLRGGSFEESWLIRTSSRNRLIKRGVARNVGFRCVVSATDA